MMTKTKVIISTLIVNCIATIAFATESIPTAGISYSDYIVGALAIVGAFSVVAKITPWTWDNKVANVLQKIINVLSLAKKKPTK